MLRFIVQMAFNLFLVDQFQYISCYGLSIGGGSYPVELTIFQYISCYGLSGTEEQCSQCDEDFNTSHVTVYPKTVVVHKKQFAFQYISCYGLSAASFPNQSIPIVISIHLMLRFIVDSDGNMWFTKGFQYISCYGLSRRKRN